MATTTTRTLCDPSTMDPATRNDPARRDPATRLQEEDPEEERTRPRSEFCASNNSSLFCGECRRHQSSSSSFAQQQQKPNSNSSCLQLQVFSPPSPDPDADPAARRVADPDSRASSGSHRDQGSASSSTNWSRRSVRHYSLTVLLLYLLVAGALATPLFTHSKRAPKPKWVNPCGINQGATRRLSAAMGSSSSAEAGMGVGGMGGMGRQHYDVRPLSDGELLENVILAAKNALRHSKVFKEEYVKKTFRASSWWEHHETWKDMRYDWLPSWQEIPKHLHEKISGEHLSQLKVDDSLIKIYTYLQKIAVGLEQVVLDQNLYGGDFMEEFNEAEFKLKAVLCEMQVAMMEKGLSHRSPTSRKIMSKDVRDIEDESFRNLRDWYIYRDYINGLEYVVHSFDHLKRNGGSGRRRR